MEVKRSQQQENAQLTLLPDHQPGGVGARQAPQPTPTGGGGYLDVCTVLDFQKKPAGAKKTAPPADPRLEELRAMGLQSPWIRAAEEVGVDAVLTIWRILDADPSSSYDGTTLRVPLRAWRTYLRYQRNRYIESLRDLGLTPQEIQRRLRLQLGESVSLPHIKRLCRRR